MECLVADMSKQLEAKVAGPREHKEELEIALNLLNFKFDCIGLTETKILKNTPANFDISLPGYKCYQTPTEASKGGTMLYMNDKFHSKQRNDLENLIYKSKELESTFVEIINPGKKNIVVGCIYRHPSMILNEFNEQYLSSLLDKLSVENKKVFIVGDFNADLMNIESNSSISNYFDIFASNCFVPHVICPSRVSYNKNQDIINNTLIDNIFSNAVNYLDGISGNITLSISDHLAQFLIIPLEYKTTIHRSDKYKRDTKNFDRENFILDLIEVDWKAIIKIQKKDPNLSFNEFEKKLNSVIDQYMPLKKMTKKELKQHYKPWITLGIRNSIRRRDSLYKKFIKAKDPIVKNEYHTQYKELRNRIVTSCRNSKKKYYQNFFENNATNLRKTWKGIKNLINLNKNDKCGPNSLVVDDKIISEPKEIANQYNNYF